MFKLDTNLAKQADNKSAFIETAGKYIGEFIRAEWMVKESTGSKGIGFTFKTNDGQEAQFYVNTSYFKDGQDNANNGGMQTINAIMTCLKLRGTGDPVAIKVEKYNKDTKSKDEVAVQGFPELMKKQIGLLLQMEIQKDAQDDRGRPTIYAPFSADTEQTASEVLNKQQPEKLARMVQAVMDKPIIDRRPAGSVYAPQQSSGQSMPDFNDDIPWD